jgi:hypothetical protein
MAMRGIILPAVRPGRDSCNTHYANPRRRFLWFHPVDNRENCMLFVVPGNVNT